MKLGSIAVTLGFALWAGMAGAGEVAGKARVGDVTVNWGELGQQPARGQKVLVFMFSPARSGGNGGVSEADWAREAARQGTDVSTMKMLLGRDVYLTRDGHVASCTIWATDHGLCDKKLGMSERERAAVAEAVLQADGRCVSAGFDPALHARMANALGAVNNVLVLGATCR